MSARLFVALWPDAAAASTVQAWRESIAWPPDARLHHPDDLHVTLVFIGLRPASEIPTLAEALSAVRWVPFDVTLDRFEAWHHGVAVLTPGVPPAPAWLGLQSAIARELARHGVEPEARAYRPHLTLGRKATGVAPPMPPARPMVRWTASSFALASSSAGRYTVLETFAADARR